jgi:2-polyprenyl-3-methyl-5-hydroxy-6-metoxy-1,4-benzoquinol methylase
MQNLPIAKIYEEEFKYMPWGILISEVLNFITKNVPKNGTVLDLLCGPGYLLGEIQKRRPDIKFIGVDLEKEFIDYATITYTKINFQLADVLTWKPTHKFDCVLCTGGLHHIPYNNQKMLIHKISNLIKKEGSAIVADPYINNYTNEKERKLAAAKLGYEYLVATIKNDAPDYMIKVALDLICNDIFLTEFKNSVRKIEPYFIEYFLSVEKHKTWPEENTEYGDYYFILRNN